MACGIRAHRPDDTSKRAWLHMQRLREAFCKYRLVWIRKEMVSEVLPRPLRCEKDRLWVDFSGGREPRSGRLARLSTSPFDLARGPRPQEGGAETLISSMLWEMLGPDPYPVVNVCRAAVGLGASRAVTYLLDRLKAFLLRLRFLVPPRSARLRWLPSGRHADAVLKGLLYQLCDT